jgi:Family of unknown function (DUF6655)
LQRKSPFGDANSVAIIPAENQRLLMLEVRGKLAGSVVQAPFRALACCVSLLVLIGCGTTRRTDTSRTATEQLLLSDAIDRSVSRIDFGLLSGRDVYLDTTYLGSAVDKDYMVSTLRQHMLSCGCVLSDKKEEAQIVVEVRAGVVGTDRHDLLFGTPATTVSLGALSPFPGTPTMFPEIALAKRTDQMGVAKIGVFAYERSTGSPIWQSGSDVVASKARDLWVFGTGPFQRGNVYGGTKFAGDDLRVPLVSSNGDKQPPVRVARERVFNPDAQTKKPTTKNTDTAAAKPPQTQSSAEAKTPDAAIASKGHGNADSSLAQRAYQPVIQNSETAIEQRPGPAVSGPEPLPPDSGFASPASYQKDVSQTIRPTSTAWPPLNSQPNPVADAPRSHFDAAWEPGN